MNRDDKSAEEKPEEQEDFEASLDEGPREEPAVGHRLSGKIVQIGEEESFVDYGGRSEAVIATRELRDENNKLRHAVGETIHATVESADGPVVLTFGRKSGSLGKATLQRRFKDRVPVEGVVKGTNKGGFEVNLAGRRAFCPYSLIDIVYCDDPSKFIDRRLPFLITRLDGSGRNIVLSRRAILEEERKQKAEETESRLKVGEVFDGIVCRVLAFGAFVDIGGIEGLLHVSQISHGRIKNPSEVLAPGQTIQVKVIGIEEGEKGRRISLSMKALRPDPWSAGATAFRVGTIVRGKVARITDFGAFVEIAEGIDGLLHVSEIATHHVKHPSEILQVGNELDVKILDVDLDKRRISLSRKALEPEETRGEERARVSEARKREKKRHEKKEKPARRGEDSPPTESMETLLDRLKKKYEDDTLG